MELLRLEHFASCVNETFVATYDGIHVDFVLVEARPLPLLPQRNAGALREPFSLLFRNSAAFLFPQRIYAMRHPRLGDTGIFIVPVAREQAGFLYQAVFN